MLNPTSRLALALMLALPALAADRVQTANGTVEGAGPQASGVREFKGIPFAQPPVGDLRWKAPQPPKSWTGIRPAKNFGPRCMQHAVFGDMGFRSDGMSEDCLYLNVWTPAKSATQSLPVLVYFFGGGYVAGDGSEPRYDGESMAARGIVSITVNYRLGVFGFLAHPDLTKEAPYHASGNYGLLDHIAALKWVQANVAAFGGDPTRVTIAGESAGSVSVSAVMATPLAKGLISAAIGESGSLLGTLPAAPLAKGEDAGVKFAESLGAHSIADLRALPTGKIHEATAKNAVGRFSIVADGYFFPEDPHAIYAAGKQAHVPLLAGWNSEEMTGRALFGPNPPTRENFEAAVRKLYPAHADEVLQAYKTDDVMDGATSLAGDRFIGFSTWKWADEQRKAGQPVYVYHFARPRPAMNASMGNASAGLAGGVVKGGDAKPAPPARGAVHSAEIEYALGNLATNKVYAWTPDDFAVSKTMEAYFANFIKTHNPNGPGLPHWPVNEVMRIDVTSKAAPEQHRDRYELLDRLSHE